ncbi:hypothetical protein HPB50_011146 [Hyalomma asiaticum]|uniref:Uncharacterized protein n=1 Tax=Hyalomma asiaticum TaxID=266040 RepID=A0ACB7TIR4_HYAAI|nr:hypothetical protein HPB50_011146 [Hyalomma asiaticum]
MCGRQRPKCGYPTTPAVVDAVTLLLRGRTMDSSKPTTLRSNAPRLQYGVCVRFLLAGTVACLCLSSLAHPTDAQEDDNSLDYSVFAGPPPEPSQCPGGAGCGDVVLDSGSDGVPSAEVVAPSSDDGGGVGSTSDGGRDGDTITFESETTTEASSNSESGSPSIVGPRPPPTVGGGAPPVPVEYTIRAGKTNITVNGTRTGNRTNAIGIGLRRTFSNHEVICMTLHDARSACVPDC